MTPQQWATLVDEAAAHAGTCSRCLAAAASEVEQGGTIVAEVWPDAAPISGAQRAAVGLIIAACSVFVIVVIVVNAVS